MPALHALAKGQFTSANLGYQYELAVSDAHFEGFMQMIYAPEAGIALRYYREGDTALVLQSFVLVLSLHMPDRVFDL